ncbi:MAG: plasmid pRiA4b ORF-3 family protein [Bacteroidetes bacterium]|nr:plasmid pRiA4b ORF-3 family protein [Bacteroidota bacterium]
MPGLKFRVLLDTDKNEEIFRDILISDNDNFESLFHCILKSFNFSGKQMASFYVSNDSWDKGHEINLMDMSYDDDSIDAPPSVMKSAVIKNFLEEPDQKFILIYDFLKMWIFLIELIGFDRTEPESPSVILSVGHPPRENSKEILEETVFATENSGADDYDENDYNGFNDFEDDYYDDDLTDYNEENN